MTASQVETEPAVVSRWNSLKVRAGLALGTAGALAAPVAAEIDFTNISALIQDVVGLLPDFMDLVIGIAPLIVTIAIIGFVVTFLQRILKWLNF